MKFVMYHYVRPDSPELPYFRALHLEDFRRQLDYFAAEFGFVRMDRFLETVDGRGTETDGVVLTFDDGLMDHYRYVVPELERRGLWGIFYVPTGMYARHKLLDVHRVHWLLGRYGGERMLAALRRTVTDEMLAPAQVQKFRDKTYARQDNDAATKEFKQALNYFVSPTARERLLDDLMPETLDEAALFEEYYVASACLADMQSRGMLIGGHSVTHSVLSTLPVARQRQEIEESLAFLDNATGGLTVRSFCYPYGGDDSYTSDTERLLSEAACRFTLKVEPRDATPADFAARPHALPRYDCNQFEHGQCRPITSQR